MNPGTSACPCIESAASCRPAIQPSVRASSAATSRRREVEAHHLVEKCGGFGGGKAQVGGAQLGQLAAGAQPGQGQRRILAGGDHQVQLRRQVLEQKGRGPHRPAGHRSRGSRRGRGRSSCAMAAMLVEQAARSASIGGGCGDWSSARALAPTSAGTAVSAAITYAQKSGVVVALVERDPSPPWPFRRRRGQPFGQQGRLAEARRGGDESELALGLPAATGRSVAGGKPGQTATWALYSLVARSVSPATASSGTLPMGGKLILSNATHQVPRRRRRSRFCSHKMRTYSCQTGHLSSKLSYRPRSGGGCTR